METNVRSKILKNLNNRVHGVNTFVAISGLNTHDGLEALEEMRVAGLIYTTHIQHLPLYRLTQLGRDTARNKIEIVVDTEK